MARIKHRETEYPETSYWQSYSDMMAGVLLMFILIICGTLFVLMQVKNNYDASELELQEREAQLIQTLAEKDDYATLTEEQEEELARRQAALDLAQLQLEEQQALLEQQQEELAAAEELLSIKDEELDQKEAQIALQKDALAEQQLQLEQIIGVKREIVAALRDEFAASELSIFVDEQTGAITLDSSVMFDFNSATLSEAGEAALAKIMPVYLGVVLSDEYIENVAEIVIEGHTDTDGTYDYNMDLSQKRAGAVAAYCVGEGQDILSRDMAELARTYISASGRSWADPVLKSDGSVDADASRRVEIKFRLKDEDTVTDLLEVLDQYED